MRAKLPASLVLLLVLLPVRAAPGAEAAGEGADAPAAAFEADFNRGDYERAREALDRLAASAPDDARLPFFKVRFLTRVGRFGDAAEAARPAGEALAARIDAWTAMRIGRALDAAGHQAEARAWTLSAARRHGAQASTGPALDYLTALIAPRGGQGLVTADFAAELCAAQDARDRAAGDYREICKSLAARDHRGEAGPYLLLAEYAARRRLAEFSESPEDFRAAAALLERVGAGAPRRILWQVPVGVEEQPERCAASGGLVLVAAHLKGRALAGAPLAARLRAYDAATGAEKWLLPLEPTMPDVEAKAAAGPEAEAVVVYESRVSDLAAAGGRAFLLLRTERFRRRGNTSVGAVADSRLLAVDLAAGKPAWSVAAPVGARRLYAAGGAVVAIGPGELGGLAGYSAADGRQLWRQAREEDYVHSAASAAGLFLAGPREALCLDPASGQVRWTLPRPGADGTLAGLLAGGQAVILASRSPDGVVAIAAYPAADAGAGKALWSRSFAVPGSSREGLDLALAGGELVAVAGGALRGLSAAEGKDLWRAALHPAGEPGFGLARPAARLVAAGGLAVWSSPGGCLAALSPASGRPAWWSPAPAGLRPLEVVSGDGPGGQVVLLAVQGRWHAVLSAWRLGPEAPPAAAGRGRAAAELLAAAEALAAAGRKPAAGRLLEIARAYAVPGLPAVELAAVRHELAAGPAGAEAADRALLAASLIAASGNRAVREAAVGLFRGLAEKAGPGRWLAGAALLYLGERAGAELLAAAAADWAGPKAGEDPEVRARFQQVMSACRAAGEAAGPALVAALGKAAEPKLRLELVAALAAHRSEQARKALEKCLADEAAEVRGAAAWSLVSVGGREALGALRAAYEAEKDFTARHRMRRSLLALGERLPHQPETVGERPRPEPRPEPEPPPRLTREQALARAARDGQVLWSRPDARDDRLLWIAVEKRFLYLYRAEDGTLTDYLEFARLMGRPELTVTAVAFDADRVWAGTDRGAFCYERRARAWSQYVVNMDMDLVEAPVEKVELTEAGVVFTVKGKGRFEFDVAAKKWRKL